MALHTSKCHRLMPLRFKGLIIYMYARLFQSITFIVERKEHACS